MKSRILRALATMAFAYAAVTAMSTSHYWFNEPEMPKALQAMKK